MNQVKQSFRTAKSEQIPILLGRQHIFLFHGIEIRPHITETVTEQMGFLSSIQRHIDQTVQLLYIFCLFFFCNEHLLPLGPEFGRCSGSGIRSITVSYAEQQSTIQVKAANTVILLITKMLGYSLVKCPFDTRTLTLYYYQWNTVNKQNYIWTVRIGHSGACYCKLFRHMKHISFRSLPVDKAHGIAFFVTINTLFKCLTQCQ